jgi:hypothetical protein
MIWFLLLPFLLFAEDTFLSSDHIAYKDEYLSLTGHVSIKHDLGVVKADEAEVTGLNKTSFLKALVKSNVEFFFKEDRLIAEELLLDSTNGEVMAKGPTKLFGSKENFSLTCDGLTHFEKKDMKLKFTSNLAPILFSKGETKISSRKAYLTFENDEPSFITFDDGVDLSNGTIHGFAEKLVYDLKDQSLRGVGKVSFHLNSDETLNLLDLWKKKSS